MGKTPESKLEASRRWRERNPDYMREYQARYARDRRERALADPEFAERESERKRLARARLKERIANDPEFAEKYHQRRREQKRRNHLRRMADDPEYAAAHVLKLRAYRKTWKARNPYDHDQHLRGRYGITSADYDRMLVEQGGRCAVCGGPPTKPRFAVDHDHETGAVRGLLCDPCNMGLGSFKDDRARLLLAVAYLDRHVMRSLAS